jgi:hypothetical protein
MSKSYAELPTSITEAMAWGLVGLARLRMIETRAFRVKRTSD